MLNLQNNKLAFAKNMSYKLRFADILRYIIIGVITIILGILVYNHCNDNDIENVLVPKTVESILPMMQAVIPVFIILCCYLAGICVQSAIKILCGDTFLGISIKEECFFIRQISKYFTLNNIPDWVYWANKPDLIIQEITEQNEIKLNNESKSEYFLLNQLFQGVCFVAYVSLLVLIYNSPGYCILKVSIGFLAIFSLILSRWNWTASRLIVLYVLFLIGLLLMGHIALIAKYYDTFFIKSILVTFVFSWFLGKYFARRHIISANSINTTDKKTLDALLLESGIPTMYILIRTNSGKYLGKTLESISEQQYPQIKTIVLEDSILKDSGYSFFTNNIETVVEDYSNKLNILYYKSNSTGPYQLSVEIRNIFLNYANKDDFAMILDSDDYLSNPNVVTNVITQLCRKRANVCLVGFEIFGKQELNYSKNYHNEFIKKIANLNTFIQFKNYKARKKRHIANELYHVSTIGWTKCYRKSVLEKYQKKILNQYRTGFEDKWTNLSKYEDFPDIIALMFKDTKITAVEHPCFRFRKEEGSVTTNVTSDNYKVQILGFLSYTEYLYKRSLYKDAFYTEESKDYIFKKFIVYKFIQYFDIVCKLSQKGKLSGYTGEDFYNDFISEFTNSEKYKTQEDECITHNYSVEEINTAIEKEWKVVKEKDIIDLSYSERYIDSILEYGRNKK